MALSVAYIKYEIVVNIYITGALCAFGIAGNVLSIIVLGRDQTIRRTTAFLLQMLAVTDAAFLVSCIFYSTLGTILMFTEWLPVAVHRGWPYVLLYSMPMASITATAAVWMVVLLTADRYIAICRPLHAAKYNTMPRLRRGVILVWVLAVIYNIPRFFEKEFVEVEPENASSSESHLRTTAVGTSKVYKFVYSTCLYFVFRIFLPLVALTFFNQRLVHALHKCDRMQCRIATNSGKQRQHTWMLVVVVIIFIVCQLPTVVWNVFRVLYSYIDIPFYGNAVNYAVVAVNFMLVVNSSINVVIYCFMGRQFRAILLRMIRCHGQHANATPNLEVDPGHPAVPLYHHTPTPNPAEQSQPGRESQTCHPSAGDDLAVHQVDVVVDVHHEMTFEAGQTGHI